MQRLLLAVSMVTLLSASASAQNPQAVSGGFSLGELTPTPEMWFYEQARRDYMSPEMMVRRKVEYSAAQRQYRIAARKWYGISLARPTANPTPFMSHYSPYWGGRGLDPWSMYGNGSAVMYSARRIPNDAIYYGIW